jgi:hypothetical protein
VSLDLDISVKRSRKSIDIMFMSEEFVTCQANKREVGSTKSQTTIKDVDDGFRVQNVTFSSTSCMYQDNAGCSIYSRALAPFVTYAICLPTFRSFCMVYHQV